MSSHLLHVGGSRMDNEAIWSGIYDRSYLEDFERAWNTLMSKLNAPHREVFRDEIDYRLASEFEHCGDLGREFIQLPSESGRLP